MAVAVLILIGWISSVVVGDSPVVINEIHYDPVPKTEHVEFIELFNGSDHEVDLSGWSIVEGVYYQFPQGLRLAPGGYLVVAGEPEAVKARFGINALGPWAGRLSNEGDTVILLDQAKRVVDRVSYKLGFPWPTVGDPPGYSIELINPRLDNALGGNWRASMAGAGTARQPVQVFDLTNTWRYNQEGVDLGQAWRQVDYDDGSWPSGAGLLCVEDAASVEPKNTRLTIGRITYYFRTSFEFTGDPVRTALQFSLMVDDGAVLYLNGQEFYRIRMPDGPVSYNTLASASVGDASLAGPLTVSAPGLVKGRNVLAVEVHQSSANSSDIVFGMTLTLVDAAVALGNGPTPGRANCVLAGDAPPCIWDAAHDPLQPITGQEVVITATVRDPNGVGLVELLYQVVEPGNYLSKADPEFEDPKRWNRLFMSDDGLGSDRLKADGVYTVAIPSAVQIHRRLIRYRIRAADGNGNSITVPYQDDPQPNFAYFVYDGVPPWIGAIQPGSSDRNRSALVLYDFETMPALPVYHLITTRKAHEESQYIPNSTAGQYWGQDYPWYGTLVYDGVVYDHIRFRARGGVWRYSMGKNMWKFDFNRGHDFEARDEYGRPLKATWKKLNLGANIQQGDYGHRGEQGLFEYVGFRLYNLAGCPASITFPVHFRIIENPSETNDTPSNQYDDDFQGLYLAVEQLDGRFLDQHGLPDGNLYKMEGGTGELNNQGRDDPSNKSDLNAFMSGYSSNSTEQWWRNNFDLEGYYSFRAITEAIHNGDIGYGKNYFYYRNPTTGKWSIFPWDLDLTWAETMYGNGNEPFKARVLYSNKNYTGPRQPYYTEYQARLREIMDLLFNSEQVDQLIEEYCALVDRPNPGASMVDADRAMWDYNPILASSYVNPSKAGQGRFYQAAATKDFRGMAQKMKDYVKYVYDNRRNWWNDPPNGPSLTEIELDLAIPDTPVVSYVGPSGYPIDHLVFKTSPYSGYIGQFAAMQWRIAEVTDPAAPAYDPAAPRRYEIETLWTSGRLTTFNQQVQIPAGVVEPGHAYRVRCRVQDSTGRWSHWSDPVQFVAGPALGDGPRLCLALSEIMYHPAASVQPDGWDEDDFEFLEFVNTGLQRLDLSTVKITGAVEFDFANGSIKYLDPGQYVLVVANPWAFECRYGSAVVQRVAGRYDGRLSNGGECIEVRDLYKGLVMAFAYDDDWYKQADGVGHSLVLVDPGSTDPTRLGQKVSWRTSYYWGGSPGKADTK